MRKYILILALFFPLCLSGQSLLLQVIAGNKAAGVSCDDGIIINGCFTSSDNWGTSTGNWTIGSGVASYNDLASSRIFQTQANMGTGIVINTAYTLTFNLTMTTGTIANLAITSSSEAAGYVTAANYNTGLITLNFTTPANIDTGGIGIRASAGGSNGTFTIDNVKLVLQ